MDLQNIEDFNMPIQELEQYISTLNLGQGDAETMFCGLELNKLDDECLLEIFKRIPNNTIDEVMGVCKRWKQLITDKLGVEVWVSDVGFRIGLKIYDCLSEMKKFKISSIKSRVMSERVPSLRDPLFLRHLEFAAPTKQETLDAFTKNATNLQLLRFKYNSLTMQKLSLSSLQLPNLTNLIILDDAFEVKNIAGPRMLVKNICNIMMAQFPSLQKFKLSTLATKPICSSYVVFLFYFIQRHCTTLKSLHVDLKTNLKNLADKSNVKRTEVKIAKDEQCIDLTSLNLSRGNLSTCRISLDTFSMENGPWKKLLEHQANLKCLDFYGCPTMDPDTFIKPVQLAFETISTIKISVKLRGDYSPIENYYLDCKLFAPCVKLKVLWIKGNFKPFLEKVVRSTVPDLENVSHLPKNIVECQLESLVVKTYDLEHHILTLKHLKKLRLNNLAVGSEHGMTLTLLNEILEAKVLQEIFVKGVYGVDNELEKYQKLIKMGLTIPLAIGEMHVSFFKHFMDYTPCKPQSEDEEGCVVLEGYY